MTGKAWSQKTVVERINSLIEFYSKAIEAIDADGTALLHETYKTDIARYVTVEIYTSFLGQLRMLQKGVDRDIQNKHDL